LAEYNDALRICEKGITERRGKGASRPPLVQVSAGEPLVGTPLTDVVDLLVQAATTRKAARKAMETIVGIATRNLKRASEPGSARKQGTVANGLKEFAREIEKKAIGGDIEDQKIVLEAEPPLKSSVRIVEKCLLRHDAPGAADRVCDVVRDMILVSSMHGIAAVLAAIHAFDEIEIVRVKDRFGVPSAGGWRDLMVNYVTSASTHDCEVQVVHANMLTARKGLPGHLIYARVRNASELLESVGLLDRRKRASQLSELRRKGWDTKRLAALGCFTEDELKEYEEGSPQYELLKVSRKLVKERLVNTRAHMALAVEEGAIAVARARCEASNQRIQDLRAERLLYALRLLIDRRRLRQSRSRDIVVEVLTDRIPSSTTSL